MFNKIRKVSVVYTNSWSFWIISGIILSSFVFVPMSISLLKMDNLAMKNSNFFHMPVIPSPETVQASFLSTKPKNGRSYRSKLQSGEFIVPDDLELNLSQFNSKSESVKVSGTIGSHFGLWKHLNNMSNLRHLDLRHVAVIDDSRRIHIRNKKFFSTWMDYSELKNLGELKKLKSLSFPSGTFDKETFEVLDKLPNLTWLDISQCHNVRLDGSYENSIASLPDLKNLETLHISSMKVLDDPDTYKKLQEFRNLQTVIVGNGLESSSYFLSIDYKNLIRRLLRLNRIDQIYLPQWFLDRNHELASHLPNIEIYSTSVFKYRLIYVFSLCWLIVIVSLMIGNSLWSQFSRPESQLIPGYSPPHTVFAFFLFAVLGCCGTLLLTGCNVAVNAAIALSLCSMSLVIFMSFPGAYSYFRWCFWSLVFLSFLYAGFRPFSIQFIDRFLEGSMHSIINGAILVSSATLVISILSMRTIYKKLIRAGFSTPIMQISDLQLISHNNKKKQSNLIFKKISSFLLMPIRLRFRNSSLVSKGMSLRKKSQTWKSLSGLTSNRVFLYSSLALTAYETVWFLRLNSRVYISQRESLSEVADSLHWDLWVILFGMTYFLVPIACIGWWKRVPMLANELCLPMTRSEILNNIHKGIWRDIGWYPILFVCLISPMYFATHSFNQSLQWLGVYFVTLMGLCLFWQGLALFCLLIRASWKIALFEFVGVLIFFVITSHISDHFIYVSVDDAVQMRILLTLGAILFIAGFLLTLFARNYWNKLEFAKLV